MNAVAVILKPVHHGWAIALTDGREIARFTGPAARWRAMRYIELNGAGPQGAFGPTASGAPRTLRPFRAGARGRRA